MSPRKDYRAWSSLEFDALQDLRWQGRSAPHIARLLGRSAASVRYAIQYYRVQRTCAARRKYVPLLLGTHSLHLIAAETGRSLSAVKSFKGKLLREGMVCGLVIRTATGRRDKARERESRRSQTG